MFKPLQGLKVIEIAGVLAGPAVGMFLAELGARVIKIENKRAGGDMTRNWKTSGEDPAAPFSSYYHSVNWGKEVQFIDLNEHSDQIKIHELLSDSDILLMNFKQGDQVKFGLERNSLEHRYPRLIVGQITGFQNGDRVAYDAVLQAEAGFMSINGKPGDDPLKLPVAFIDLMAAHQLKEGILLALLERNKTGKGSLVQVSLYQAAIASLANQASSYLNTGIEPLQLGSLHPSIAPYGEVFTCADGRCILLAIGTDEQFGRLCRIVNGEHLASDLLYMTNASRVKNRSELAAEIGKLIASFTSEDLLLRLHEARVPAASVNTISRVFESEDAKSLILQQTEPDGSQSKRVATAVFKIYPYE